MRKHFTYESKYGNYEDCYFEVIRYATNNNLAIKIISETEGPITVVTTNTNRKLPDTQIAIKDYSENEGMVNWLYSMGIIGLNPVETILSGFVEIPVYEVTDTGREWLEL